MAKVISLNDVSFYYNSADIIFDHVSVSFPSGKINIVLGESGAGKTTLLSLILGKNKCNEGSITYNHEAIDTTSFLRNHISYIDQDATCFDNMKIKENFQFIDQILERISERDYMISCLERLGLNESILKKYPKNLSGGERKRFLIALALYKNSDIILLDEPTASLDDNNTQQLMNILTDIIKEDKIIILVTHDKRVIHNSDCDTYVLENHKITSKQKITFEGNHEEIKDFKEKRFIRYINYKNRFQKILIILLIIIGTFMISLTGETLFSNYRISHKISDTLESSVIKEIHLRKINFDTSIVDGFRSYDSPETNSRTLKINSQELSDIRDIEGVEDILTYPVLFSDGYSIDHEEQEPLTSVEINSTTKGIADGISISVIPSYDNDSTLISQHLADQLGLTGDDFKNNTVKIKATFGLPVGECDRTEETGYSKYNDETKSYETYITCDLDYLDVIYEKHEVELNVSGIIQNDNDSDYFCNTYDYFITGINNIDQIIEKYNGKNLNRYKDEYPDIEPYTCEDYIVKVKDIDDLESVDQQISEMNNLYDVSCVYLNAKENISVYYTNIKENRFNTVILVCICIGSFVLVISYYMFIRKKEIVLLKQSGLTGKEISFIFNFELFIIMILWILLCAGGILYRLDDPGFVLQFYLKGKDLFLSLIAIECILVGLVYSISNVIVRIYVRGVMNDRV